MLTWMAAYPRSGTTWLRKMLDCYVHGDWGDGERAAETVPDLHRLQVTGGEISTDAIVKTHFTATDDHPYWEYTGKILYLVRHPLAVMHSAAQWFGEGVTDDLYRHGGVPNFTKAGFGRWPEHVASWMLAMQQYPSLVVRYEDLRIRTYEEMQRIVRFLYGEPDSAQEAKDEATNLTFAVNACHLENMRKQEDTEASDVFYEAPRGRHVHQGHTRVTTDSPVYANTLGQMAKLVGYA